MIACPLCGHTQERGEECEICGKRLIEMASLEAPAQTLPDLETTPTPPPPSSELPQKKCRYCGRTQDTGRFCESCGMSMPTAAPAESAEAETDQRPACAGCGIPVPPGQRCPSCGAVVHSKSGSDS